MVSPRRRLDLEATLGISSRRTELSRPIGHEDLRSQQVSQIRENYYDEKRRYEREIQDVKEVAQQRLDNERKRYEVERVETIEKIEEYYSRETALEVAEVRRSLSDKYASDLDLEIEIYCFLYYYKDN